MITADPKDIDAVIVQEDTKPEQFSPTESVQSLSSPLTSRKFEMLKHEISEIKDELNDINDAIKQLRFSVIFSEDTANAVIRDIGSLKRSFITLLSDFEEVKNAIAINKLTSPTTSSSEILHLHKSLSSDKILVEPEKPVIQTVSLDSVKPTSSSRPASPL